MASEITVTFGNGGVYNGFASTYTVNDIVTYYFSFDLDYRVQIDKTTQSITAEQYRVQNGAWYDINIITSVAVKEISGTGQGVTMKEVQEWVQENYYDKTTTDDKYVKKTGDTMTGQLSIIRGNDKYHFGVQVGENEYMPLYASFANGTRIQLSKDSMFISKGTDTGSISPGSLSLNNKGVSIGANQNGITISKDNYRANYTYNSAEIHDDTAKTYVVWSPGSIGINDSTLGYDVGITMTPTKLTRNGNSVYVVDFGNSPFNFESTSNVLVQLGDTDLSGEQRIVIISPYITYNTKAGSAQWSNLFELLDFTTYSESMLEALNAVLGAIMDDIIALKNSPSTANPDYHYQEFQGLTFTPGGGGTRGGGVGRHH